MRLRHIHCACPAAVHTRMRLVPHGQSNVFLHHSDNSKLPASAATAIVNAVQGSGIHANIRTNSWLNVMH